MNFDFISRRVLLKNGGLALTALGGAALASVSSPVAAQAPALAPGAPIKLALVEGLSGPFANAGEAVYRNLLWAVERVNQRGGVALPGGARPLRLDRYDSKGQNDEALSAMRAALDDGALALLQGNSSAVAAALVDALDKHNQRNPTRQALFLNYAAVDPALTQERCSYWHFRFDAHADMRLAALMDVLKDDRAVQRVYLIGQDYSFGQAVLRESRRQLGQLRPDIEVAAEELHPMGRVKDFAPYAAKIQASGAQAVITGNWGNDLTLLVKAAREAGYDGKFYTFYGNALGVPAALGDAGVGKVVAVADWMPNVATRESAAFYESFRQRFPNPADDYVHLRMQLMIEALAQSVAQAGSTEARRVAARLAQSRVRMAGREGHMRAADHQFQQPLVVGLMDRQGAPGVPYDVEGSGYGFRVIKDLPAARAEMPSSCRMVRPG